MRGRRATSVRPRAGDPDAWRSRNSRDGGSSRAVTLSEFGTFHESIPLDRGGDRCAGAIRAGPTADRTSGLRPIRAETARRAGFVPMRGPAPGHADFPNISASAPCFFHPVFCSHRGCSVFAQLRLDSHIAIRTLRTLRAIRIPLTQEGRRSCHGSEASAVGGQRAEVPCRGVRSLRTNPPSLFPTETCIMRHRPTAWRFTLIELLVVIAIIGVLIALLLRGPSGPRGGAAGASAPTT
jgi:prepilin-type N-terminal cleavage/methylation domain-containing protein